MKNSGERKIIRKSVMLFFSFMSIFFVAASAGAGTYDFEDLIDYWSLDGTNYGETQTFSHWSDSVAITESNPLQYTHYIDDSVDFASGHRVTSASLELDFTNDLFDGTLFFPNYDGPFNANEYISYAFNETYGWTSLGEVDDGQYTVLVDLGLLNVDGQLVVDLKVTNNASGPATAYLDHSRLFGTAKAVPEPSTILLLGAGLVGLAGYRYKKRLRD